MLSAFKERRPWATVVLILLVGPFATALYLGRGRLAAIYLLAEILIYSATYFVVIALEIEANTDLARYAIFTVFKVPIAVHFYIIARSKRADDHVTWFSSWYAVLILALFLPFLAASFLKEYFFEAYSAASHSMAPALMKGDQFVASKMAYGYSKFTFGFGPFVESGRIFGALPERGDIIVFKLPTDNRTDFVKRVVGLPGDKIQMILGQLFINNVPVEMEKVEPITLDEGGPSITTHLETLPNGVTYGILDEAEFRHGDDTSSYVVPEGQLFVMGDHRDNSNDSRYPGVGYVPVENVMGKVVWVYWRDRERKIAF